MSLSQSGLETGKSSWLILGKPELPVTRLSLGAVATHVDLKSRPRSVEIGEKENNIVIGTLGKNIRDATIGMIHNIPRRAELFAPRLFIVSWAGPGPAFKLYLSLSWFTSQVFRGSPKP